MNEPATHDTGPVALQWCPRCERGVARERCRVIRLGDESAWACPECDGLTRAVTTAEHRPLGEVFRTAWRYPLAGDGVIALGALGVGTWIGGHIRITGSAIAFTLVATYAFSIVRKSAAGDDDLPAPADFIDWFDFFKPAVRALAAGLLAFIPVIAFAALGVDADGPGMILYALGALFAVAWLPASVISASYADNLADAVNPLPIVAMMQRIPKDYALTVVVLWGWSIVGLVLAVVAQVVARLIAVPILPSIAAEVVGLYAPLVMARTLGLLLRERKIELGLED
jgi:hypothetical protein